MSKVKPPAPKARTTGPLPIIDKAPEPQKPQPMVGVFNPNILEYPNHTDMVAILFVLGLQTPVIAGQDQQGNLVNETGNIVVPAKLRQFFQLAPYQEATKTA